MYVCMYPCTFPLLPSISRKKSVFAKRTSKNIEFFPDFRQKDAGSPSQQKSRQGESSLGPLFCDTGSPKTTFSGTSSNCRAVRGGPPPKKKKTYVIDVGRGGVRGGVILYPLVSIRHAEQCRRIGSKSTIGFHPWPNHSSACDRATSGRWATRTPQPWAAAVCRPTRCLAPRQQKFLVCLFAGWGGEESSLQSQGLKRAKVGAILVARCFSLFLFLLVCTITCWANFARVSFWRR